MNLNQVTVPSLNVEKSITFYKTLGLKLIVQALPHYARFECPDGDATFSVHLTEQLPDGDGIYVYFECVDLDNYVTELLNNQIIIDQMPQDKRWLWREARLKDPDGNQIILYYGGKNRKDPPWKIEN